MKKSTYPAIGFAISAVILSGAAIFFGDLTAAVAAFYAFCAALFSVKDFTSQEPDHWVRIKDQLPPRGTLVMFTCENEDFSGWEEVKIGSWSGRYTEGGFCAIMEVDKTIPRDWPCTLWREIPVNDMPVPE